MNEMVAIYNPLNWLIALIGLTIATAVSHRVLFDCWLRADDALWVVTTLMLVAALSAVYALREPSLVVIALALMALFVVLLLGAWRRESSNPPGVWRPIGFLFTMVGIIAISFVIATWVMQ